jgi:hypothetical protein
VLTTTTTTHREHAARLREMISELVTGAALGSFGPSYVEALQAAVAALDPDNTLPEPDASSESAEPAEKLSCNVP